MAELTYNVWTGELVVRSQTSGRTLIAFAESGASNLWWHSGQREVGGHGTPGHVEGGPIPTGRWRVGSPGSGHPDGGRLRHAWIPIGPIPNRKFIYIHHERRTEGCINIAKGVSGNDERWQQILKMLRDEHGGWINVIGGDVPQRLRETV